MKTNILRGLLVLGVVLSLVAYVSPVMPALARDPASYDPDRADHRISQASRDAQTTGTEKMLIPNIAANQTVALYVVEGSQTPAWNGSGEPNGTFAGAQQGSADGKSLEFFLPVSGTSSGPGAKVNNLFMWSESTGWQLLESVIVTPNGS